MTNIILVALVQVSALGASQQDFNQAYHQSLTTGRPLVVLVGAGWCPACQKMKNSILPQVAKSGGLNKVVFTHVDFDQQRQLASRLSRGTSIPQLIRFDQTPAGWKSKRLVGARSPGDVYHFINTGLIDGSRVTKVSATDRPRDNSRQSTPGEAFSSASATPKSGSDPSVDPKGGPALGAQPYPIDKAGGFSYWMVFLKQLSAETRNQHDSTVHQQDQPSK